MQLRNTYIEIKNYVADMAVITVFIIIIIIRITNLINSIGVDSIGKFYS